MAHSSKFMGTTFIVAGTTIGASMLALPLVAAKVGLLWAFILMMASWLFMLKNAHIILRMMGPYPKFATFRSIAQDALGPWGRHAITGAMMFLFYALLAAYGAGASSLLQTYFPIGSNLMVTLLFLVLGGVILWSTALADYLNRLLFASLLLFVGVTMIPLWDVICVTPFTFKGTVPQKQPLLAALLIYITSFGFHGSIASLVTYNDQRMGCVKRAFFWGTLLAVFLYLLWIMMTTPILDAPNLKDVSHVIGYLTLRTGEVWVGFSLSLFALVAILTSFIGVGMGLSNDLHDLLGAKRVPKKVLQGLITFLPPYIILMANATSIFIKALEYAGVALMIIAVLIPNTIVLKLGKRGDIPSTFSSTLLSWGMIACSILLIFLYFG